MNFYVNPYDGIPVYLQIIQQVRNAISHKILKPGDKLPTVRELAVNLKVNPNTVAKAYHEMELEKIVETFSGKGTYISDKAVEKDFSRLDKLIEMLLYESKNMGLSIKEIKKRIDELEKQ
jgi:GntR family transcriptional regulator